MNRAPSSSPSTVFNPAVRARRARAIVDTSGVIGAMRPAAASLLEAEGELGVLGHHFRGPGGLEDHLRVDRGDTGEVADELLHLLGDLGADRAGGSGQGEGDVDVLLLDRDVVDEAEGDEVEAELGIDDLLERLVDVLL